MWIRVGAVVAVAAVTLVVPAVPVAARAAGCGPVVTDPLAEAPWPLQRLRPENAWPLSVGTGVTVAVVDSGVSTEHPTLAGKVRPGRDFVAARSDTPGTCDENGHGTLIAGIIAGRENTSAGYRFHGMAPAATIVPVRVLRDQRRSTEAGLSDTIAEAVRWSVDQGDADVINLSLTTPPTPGLEQAIAYAIGKRVVVVAAAGNEGDGNRGTGQPVYPAAYPGVIAVAGVNEKDEHVSSSTPGDFVDISAPGDNIAGPSPVGGGYLFTQEGGTSFAAAYVSGVAALIRGYSPDLSPDEVARRITATADHPPQMWTREVGHGVVNPARAVGALRPAAVAAAGGERVPNPAREVDPLASSKAVAGWVGGVGAVVALLALLLVPVVRRGRQRGWRPGL